jgi:hypothetical protein
MRAFLSRYLDRTLPEIRPDEMFFAAGPPPAPKPLVTAEQVRPRRPQRRGAARRHWHRTAA